MYVKAYIKLGFLTFLKTLFNFCRKKSLLKAITKKRKFLYKYI